MAFTDNVSQNEEEVTYELVPCGRKPEVGEMRFRYVRFGNLESVMLWPQPIMWTGKRWTPV